MPKTIFVVEDHTDDDTDVIRGIFTTLEEAEACKDRLAKSGKHGGYGADLVSINAYDVGRDYFGDYMETRPPDISGSAVH